MKEKFHLTDEDFQTYQEDIGFDQVSFDLPIHLTEQDLQSFKPLLVLSISVRRLRAPLGAYGKTMYDLLRLRNKIVENVPDAVLYPTPKSRWSRSSLLRQAKIPVYVYGGGSSVTRGVECMKGGISLDLRLRFNKVVSFNEVDQTITVEAGMSGPKLEETLNNAVSLFGAKRASPAVIFPQSFGVFFGRRMGGLPAAPDRTQLLRLHFGYCARAGIRHSDWEYQDRCYPRKVRAVIWVKS